MNADPELIEEFSHLPWLPPGAVLRTYLTTRESPASLTKVVLALVFKGKDLLLVDNPERGWDVPGGHVESGETLSNALIREVREEATVEIDLVRPFAQIEITTPPGVLNGIYPTPTCYMLFYLAKAHRELPFNRTHETLGRSFFSPTDAKNVGWVKEHHVLYEAALREASQW